MILCNEGANLKRFNGDISCNASRNIHFGRSASLKLATGVFSPAITIGSRENALKCGLMTTRAGL